MLRVAGLAASYDRNVLISFALDLHQQMLLPLQDSAAAATAAAALHDVLVVAGHRHATTGM